MNATNELSGSSSCPICGYDKPHGHTKDVIAAYRDDQIRQDGWTSAVKANPKDSGWYLCVGVAIDRKQNYSDPQLSWFLWVRDGGATRDGKDIPEVLYFDKMRMRWGLRNLLGNASMSGAERRWTVEAQPRYWREVQPLPKDRP